MNTMTRRPLIAQALRSLLAYRLRALLSSIGCVVGIATVVTALAIGEGARRVALDEIGALGIDNLFVRAVRASSASGEAHAGTAAPLPRAPTLTLDDARAIERRVADVKAVAAVRRARVEIANGSRRVSGSLLGVTTTWPRIASMYVERGRALNERDQRDRRRVGILGHALAMALFPAADPVGREVRAGDTWFRVIGVLDDASGRGTRRGTIQQHDPGLALIVPLAAMDISLGMGDAPDRVEEIVVQAADANAVSRVAASIDRALRRRAGHASTSASASPSTPASASISSSTSEPPYEIVVPRQLLQARLRAQRTFTIVLLAVGGLALLISGIGVMNVMLGSVIERTHEIGVRRAFGARRRDIVTQFALEAVALCLAGGLVGVPLGAVLATLVARLAGWPTALSLFAIVVALGTATAIGLLCGIYPARLAARLDPAAALRRA